jgi:hypothetical protein
MKTVQRGISRRRTRVDWRIVAPIQDGEPYSVCLDDLDDFGIGTSEDDAFRMGREYARNGWKKKAFKRKQIQRAFNRGYKFQGRFSK